MNHFSLRLFAKIEKRDTIDGNKVQQLNRTIECIDFFRQTDWKHFSKNYRVYKKKISRWTNTDSDLFFLMYPYRVTSIFLANILSDTDLTIWVKSDYVGLFGVSEDTLLRQWFKKMIGPAISFIYPRVTQHLFDGNVIFYTGDIIYDRDNHLNQYGITSLSPLNTDSSRIDRSIKNKAVFVGNESNQKGLQFLLEALQLVERDLELTIIGMDELSKYSGYSGLDINCLGVIYDNETFYDELANHDILVMPSICERQGKVHLEAMSAGVVPICSDSGGTYTTIDNYYSGLLFEEKDVDELAQAIKELYNHPSLYDKLQENGLKYTEKFSLEDQVNKMATIIKNQYSR